MAPVEPAIRTLFTSLPEGQTRPAAFSPHWYPGLMCALFTLGCGNRGG